MVRKVLVDAYSVDWKTLEPRALPEAKGMEYYMYEKNMDEPKIGFTAA